MGLKITKNTVFLRANNPKHFQEVLWLSSPCSLGGMGWGVSSLRCYLLVRCSRLAPENETKRKCWNWNLSRFINSILTHISQELRGQILESFKSTLLIAVTMVTSPPPPSSDFWSCRVKWGGLALGPLEVNKPGKRRMWKTAWGTL